MPLACREGSWVVGGVVNGGDASKNWRIPGLT
jgi:hypothetical protein